MSIRGKDIAKEAGVSRAAVSLALNNKPGISDDTREKILKIANDLGYSSRVIIKENSEIEDIKTILLLVCWRNCNNLEGNDGTVSYPEMSRGFYSELIGKIESKVNEYGYQLWLKSIYADKELGIKMAELMNSPKISGILLVATGIFEEDVLLVNKFDKNIVVIDSLLEHLDLDCVVMDNVQGGYLAADYLINLGHTDIVYVQSINRINNFIMREKGFKAALEKRGVKLDPKNVISVNPNIESSFQNLQIVFENMDKFPTAIFAESDHIAISSIKELIGLGYKIPEQISVIGFDNIEAAHLITPGLTTINVPKAKMADLAVDRLIQKIQNRSEESIKQLVTVKLIERQTCRKIHK